MKTLQTYLTALLLLLPLCAAQADVIRVTGRVVAKDNPNMGLARVHVLDARSNRVLTSTDNDGRFALDFHDNGTLRFQLLGLESVTVKVKGRKFIQVDMANLDVEIGDAVVSVKRDRKKIMPEPTDIEVKGNWLYIKTRVRVPHEMFSSNTRLVVQPILNNVTRQQLTLMKPLVFDGKEYHTTQTRMYDYQLAGRDSLAVYATVKSDSTRERGTKDKNDIIGYSDSIYVKDVREDYACDVYMALEDYQKIFYRDTTTIARGTVNPLRFLEYDFQGMPLTDPAYYPDVEKQLRDTHGEINLFFPIGKSDLDLSNPQNRAELDKLNDQLDSIRSGRGTILQAFDITGTASPDGSLRVNKSLAERRMQSALSYIVSRLDPETRNQMEVGSKAQVASWNDVAALLRKDSLYEEANTIEDIVRASSNPDEQGRRLRRSGFYQLLLDKYCPSLRRVEYQLQYSIFRQLTFDEIKELYRQDYRQLSRFEFFTLFRAEADERQKETQLRQALEVYPSFTVAANDLQELLIRQHRPDVELTRAFSKKDAPTAINVNHVVAQLANGEYSPADTTASYIPDMEQTRLIKAVVGVLNGNYEGNYETVASTGLQNEVVVLMAMKRNTEALEKAKQLPKEKAISHYLLAACLNRMEDISNAYMELKEAIEMDPSLEETAKIDGDVNDLLELAKK